jgi:hypothetical protein
VFYVRQHSSLRHVLDVEDEKAAMPIADVKPVGFFAPKGQVYSWTAGPEGCTFLEVHDKGDFLTLWRDPKSKWLSHKNWAES